MKSVDELKTDLDQLKLALQRPQLYIFNHFEKLKNEIDIACQTRLESENSSQIHLDNQAQIINKVNSFEEECMSTLIDGELETDFVESINERIMQIKANFNNFLFTNVELQEQISDLKLIFHKRLFLNKTMIFLTENQSFIEANIFGKIEDFFGMLLIIDDEFVNNESFSDWDYEERLSVYKYQSYFNQDHLKCIVSGRLVDELLDSLGEQKCLVPVFEVQLNLDHLETISLNNLNLEKLSDQIFKEMKIIKQIDLNQNLLSSLNNRIFHDLKNLEILRLNNNNLSELDSCIFDDLTNLLILNLLRNKLTNLYPGIFTSLKNLKELDLQHNCIKIIDFQTFQSLENLEKINLAFNGIIELKEGIFTGLKNLQIIDLSGNDLKTLKSNLFSGLCNLTAIILNDNQIEELDCQTFQGLNNIEYINLGYNKLSEIKAGLFDNNFKLKYLVLKNNLISEIDAQRVFKDLDLITEIDISGNKINSSEYEKIINQIDRLTIRKYETIDGKNEIDTMFKSSGINKYAAM